MHLVTDEIKQLQLKILELEKLKILELEKQKKLIDYNFNVINSILTEKKTSINNNKYSKSIPLARYYDQQLVIQLEAIYYILQNVDERLKKLETYLQK
jgi:hypothetical protein